MNRLDEVLEPYAMLNYEKHLKIAEEFGYQDKEKYARELTKKNIYDSMQGFEYEINTLYTSNGQTPKMSKVHHNCGIWPIRIMGR